MSEFPFAPAGWAQSDAEEAARQEGLALKDDHLQVIKAIQEYFSKHDKPEVNMRELHDAPLQALPGRPGRPGLPSRGDQCSGRGGGQILR